VLEKDVAQTQQKETLSPMVTHQACNTRSITEPLKDTVLAEDAALVEFIYH